MANEKVNKVILGSETLIDLTGDTVTANSLLAGATAHDNRGEQIQGAVSVPEELNDLNDVDINSSQEGDVLVSDENGVYQNQPKSLYPSAPTMTWAEYQQLVDDEEDDPDAEYYIDDVDVAEAYYVETSGQTAITGATSLTFTNSHIKPTADIRILAEPASCKVATNPQYKVSAKLSSVGSGTATITFPALAENTEFWLLIECPLAITQNDETKADKIDLASINVIGSTNTTGSVIYGGTYFYLNGLLVRAKADIATNATFTLNTNYEVVTAGALNERNIIYSTTEKVVGYWHDGRKIYEKSMSGTVTTYSDSGTRRTFTFTPITGSYIPLKVWGYRWGNGTVFPKKVTIESAFISGGNMAAGHMFTEEGLVFVEVASHNNTAMNYDIVLQYLKN